ncbi:MAG TPA: hypothetical protein VK928_11220 [Longimicrobiales bacterium]|nr:hypothetical protein [Longimicrobiales bacterium]
MKPQSRTAQPLALGLVMAALTAACADHAPTALGPSASTIAASTLSMASGDDQIAAPGATLARRLTVLVLDEHGTPLQGVDVAWTPAGGGSVDRATTRTSSSGRSANYWTLGTDGAQQLQAEVVGLAPVTFTARLIPPDATIEIMKGNNQVGTALAPLAAPLTVRVLDADDQPIAGVVIDWQVTAGSGSVSRTQTTTSLTGRTSTHFTLGPGAAQTVRAQAGGIGAVTFSATTGPLDGPLQDHEVWLVNSQGLTLNARLYVPAGPGPFPAVVALHGCGGMLNGSTLRSQFTGWGERLSIDEDMVVLFVDSFTPRDLVSVCGDGSLINEAVDRVHDAYAGLAFLRALPFVEKRKIAVLGWSNGGSAALSAVARDGNPEPIPTGGGFRRAIAFYPGCGLRGEYGSPATGTWLPYTATRVLHAGLDPLQPNCVLRVARAVELGASNVTRNPVRMTTYAGAQHSFDLAADGDPDWTAADLSAQAAARTAAVDMLRRM